MNEKVKINKFIGMVTHQFITYNKYLLVMVILSSYSLIKCNLNYTEQFVIGI